MSTHDARPGEPPEPQRWRAKLRQLLVDAVAAHDPIDRAERVIWCQVFGRHGVTAYVEGDAVRFRGGRDLAIVERAVLADDDLDLPTGEFVPTDVPDTVPEEWGRDERCVRLQRSVAADAGTRVVGQPG